MSNETGGSQESKHDEPDNETAFHKAEHADNCGNVLVATARIVMLVGRAAAEE